MSVRSQNRGLGNFIEVLHTSGAHFIYAHLSVMHVKEGDGVDAGEHIGAVGNSGKSTGPHLHFRFDGNRDGDYRDVIPASAPDAAPDDPRQL